MTAKLAEEIAEAAKPDFEIYELDREDFIAIEVALELATETGRFPRVERLRDRFRTAHTAFILSEPEQS